MTGAEEKMMVNQNILRAVESLWTDHSVAGKNQPLAGHLQDCGPAGLLREDIRKIINR